MVFIGRHEELELAGSLPSGLDETVPSPLGVVVHLTLDVFELVSVDTPSYGIAVEPVTVVGIKSHSEMLIRVVGVVRAEVNVFVFDSPNFVGATCIDDIDGPNCELIIAGKSSH